MKVGMTDHGTAFQEKEISNANRLTELQPLAREEKPRQNG